MSQTPQPREVEPGMCRCGCNSKAVYRCEGFDAFAGQSFTERTCHSAAEYLREVSAEIGFPFTMTPIEESNGR